MCKIPVFSKFGKLNDRNRPEIFDPGLENPGFFDTEEIQPGKFVKKAKNIFGFLQIKPGSKPGFSKLKMKTQSSRC